MAIPKHPSMKIDFSTRVDDKNTFFAVGLLSAHEWHNPIILSTFHVILIMIKLTPFQINYIISDPMGFPSSWIYFGFLFKGKPYLPLGLLQPFLRGRFSGLCSQGHKYCPLSNLILTSKELLSEVNLNIGIFAQETDPSVNSWNTTAHPLLFYMVL